MRLGLVLLMIGLGGCAPLATVKHTNPRPVFAPDTEPGLVEAESYLTNGQRLERREPTRALGEYLACARLASLRLERQPSETPARDLYNFSVARCIEVIETAPLDPWCHSLVVPGPDGKYILTTIRHAERDRNPVDYGMIPTDTMTAAGAMSSRWPIRSSGICASTFLRNSPC